MTLPARIFKNSTWLVQTLLFFKNHFAIILGLGMIAAFGRATQMGAFGEISSISHAMLEVAIQTARISIFVYALGLTNVQRGLSRLKRFFTSKKSWKGNWFIARTKLRLEWKSLLMSIFIYLLIAVVINKLIDYATYQTCLYFKLKTNELISDKASEWVIILFLKNLSVIPFTLVFNALFLLWITNKTVTSSKN